MVIIIIIISIITIIIIIIFSRVHFSNGDAKDAMMRVIIVIIITHDSDHHHDGDAKDAMIIVIIVMTVIISFFFHIYISVLMLDKSRMTMRHTHVDKSKRTIFLLCSEMYIEQKEKSMTVMLGMMMMMMMMITIMMMIPIVIASFASPSWQE